MAVDPAKTYHGKPCKNCAQTLKWCVNHSCVACIRRRDRERMREVARDPEYAKRHREAEQARCEDPIYYYSKLLKNRRRAALKRVAQRNERRRTNG